MPSPHVNSDFRGIQDTVYSPKNKTGAAADFGREFVNAGRAATSAGVSTCA